MPVDPAVLTTRESWDYCGGRPFFEELIKSYPHLLIPIRQKLTAAKTKGKTQYLKTVIDQTLKAAQMDQRFVEK